MFGRLLTALVTPFDDEGNVNYHELLKLVEYVINNGSDGLVILGTTGEGFALKEKEKIKIINFVKRISVKRFPIVVNVGTYNTIESIEFAKKVEKIGVDGLMVVTPYYCKPQQEGVYEHVKAIHDATTLPIMLYEIPSRTGIKLEFATIEKIATLPRVTAIKFASTDLDLAEQIINNTKLNLYCGNDDLILKMVKRGAIGAVSVVSHIRGKEVKEIIEKQSFSIMKDIKDITNAIFLEPNPAPIKYALNKSGFNVGTPRLPLIDIQPELKQKIDELLN